MSLGRHTFETCLNTTVTAIRGFIKFRCLRPIDLRLTKIDNLKLERHWNYVCQNRAIHLKDWKSRNNQKNSTVLFSLFLSKSRSCIKQLTILKRLISWSINGERNIFELNAANQLSLGMFSLVTITIPFRSNVLITAERGSFSLKLFPANFSSSRDTFTRVNE